MEIQKDWKKRSSLVKISIDASSSSSLTASGSFHSYIGSEEKDILETSHQNQNNLSVFSVSGSATSVEMELAKALLLSAKWMQHTLAVQPSSIVEQYKAIIKLQPRWEKGHFHLARYYDSLLVLHLATRSLEQEFELLYRVISTYARALHLGNHYIYQALPRMLTLWFEFGSKANNSKENSQQQKRLNSKMKQLMKELPDYQFYACLPQLVSRVCHPNNQVWELLSALLSKILKQYPPQAMWNIIGVTKSLSGYRNSRANSVLSKAKAEGLSPVIVEQVEMFSTFLLDLCNLPIAKNHQGPLSLTKEFPNYRRNINKKPLEHVLLPLQASLAISIPKTGSIQNATQVHHSFAPNITTVQTVHDQVDIMNSLQKPRRITIKVTRKLVLSNHVGKRWY